ncbi:MAG: hypothetical protein OSA40_12395 [Phycisphaerales bacterium]|nr:hypothetical protein [Phycisphaerales bacterium]
MSFRSEISANRVGRPIDLKSVLVENTKGFTPSSDSAFFGSAFVGSSAAENRWTRRRAEVSTKGVRDSSVERIRPNPSRAAGDAHANPAISTSTQLAAANRLDQVGI